MVEILSTLEKKSETTLRKILTTFLHRIQNILLGKPYTIEELHVIINQINELTAASLLENMDILGIETSPIIGDESKEMHAKLLEIYNNLPRIQRTLYLMAQNDNTMLTLNRELQNVINGLGVSRLVGVEYITNIPRLIKDYELIAKAMKFFIDRKPSY